MAISIGVASLAIGAGTAVNSARQGQKAEDAQNEQLRLNRAEVNSKDLADRRRINRESRIARAKTIQAGINTGVGFDSSITQGKIGSIGTISGQLAGQSLSTASLKNEQITQQQNAITAQRRQQEQAALSSLAFSVAGLAAGQIETGTGGKLPSEVAGKPPAAGQVTAAGQSPIRQQNIFQGQTTVNRKPFDLLS